MNSSAERALHSSMTRMPISVSAKRRFAAVLRGNCVSTWFGFLLGFPSAQRSTHKLQCRHGIDAGRGALDFFLQDLA